MIVSVIARGHSGSRIPAQILKKSGVFMGNMLARGDMVPAGNMYKAAQLAGKNVRQTGWCEWDFSALIDGHIPGEFRHLLSAYLSPLKGHDEPKGWKLPETILTFPWLVRVLPDVRYIYLIRDPRDVILGEHLTDHMDRFNIPHSKPSSVLEKRAISWKYQYDIVQATPVIKHFLKIRFEDLVLDAPGEIKRMEEFLGMPLKGVRMNENAVERWKDQNKYVHFPFLKEACLAEGYTWEGDS